jgi:hypothetical protein
MIAVAVVAMLLGGMAWVVTEQRIAEGGLGNGDLIPQESIRAVPIPEPLDPCSLEPILHR